MNDVIKAIENRYSCRDFSEKIIPDDIIKVLSDTALHAPSARNIQPWHIIVVKNKELINDMDEEVMNVLSQMPDKTIFQAFKDRGGKILHDAPLMMLICINESLGSRYELIDCGIVAQNIALAATSLGIGSTHCGMVNIAFSGSKKDEFTKRLNIPEGYRSALGVLLGYPNSEGIPHEIDASKVSIVS